MICTRAAAAVARTHSLSPFSLFSAASSSSLNSLLRRTFKPYTTSSPPSVRPIKMSSSSQSQIVEHFVLFKVKPDTDPTKVAAMVNGLNGLVSLDPVLYLSAGPVLRNRSTSLTFTHMLHSRYRSKEDLTAYAIHPDHVGVVKEFVKPIIDDIMAVDWIAHDLEGPVSPLPGSAMRVTFLKLKEGLGEKEKDEVLGVIGGIKSQFPAIDQISFGENFSLDRAKGHTLGSIAILAGTGELDSLDSNYELVNTQKDKVRGLLESVVVLDYVVPPLLEAASL